MSYEKDNDITLLFDTGMFDNFSVYANLTIQIPISYNIPENLKEGAYPINITVKHKDENVTTKTPLNFTVVDNLPPQILEIVYNNSVRDGLDFKIMVKAKDNLNISEVSVFFRDYNETKKMSKVDEFYVATHNMKTVANIFCIINATDKSGNSKLENISFNTSRFNDINFSTTEYVQINKAELFRFPVFTSNLSVPFCINISYISFIATGTNDSALTYFLYVDDNKETFDLVTNSTQTKTQCFEGKKLEFAFKSDNEGQLDTLFKIGFPNWVYGNSTFNISTVVGERVIERRYTLDFGDSTMLCTYNYTRLWECTTTYDGGTDLQDLGRPMTEREYNQILREANATAKMLETNLNVANFFNNILMVILIIFIVCGVIYYLFQIKGVQLNL
jgi:hypothetical protein